MNSEDSRNLILAIVLSVLVLIGWNYFYAPQLQKDHVAATPPAQTQTQAQTAPPGSAPASVNGASAPQVVPASETSSGPAPRRSPSARE